MSIRFIHTADIHFGMENYGRIDRRTGMHSRLLDFKRVLDYMVDYAIDQHVDFFLFAGDAYKTANPTPTHQRLLFGCLLRLWQAGIPVVLVVGNHDNPLSYGRAHALDVFGQLPLEGFHVISQPRTILLETKNGPVQIVGIPWPTRNTVALRNPHLSPQVISREISRGVVHIISEQAVRLDPAIPAVLSGHLTVANGLFSGSEKQALYGTDPLFMVSDLAISPFEYVALGHLHRFQDLNKNHQPPVVYSGSPERIDFGERNEDKGFCVVTLAGKQNVSYEFIKTPVRPFIQIDVHITTADKQTELIIERIKGHILADAIVKIVYYVPAAFQDRVDMARVQHACKQAWYLVGIFPVRAPNARRMRSDLAVDMSFKKLMSLYFENRKEYAHIRASLLEKALMLEAEWEASLEKHSEDTI